MFLKKSRLILEIFEDFLCILLFFNEDSLEILSFIVKVILKIVKALSLLFFDGSNVGGVESFHFFYEWRANLARFFAE